jgi:hypothetical protein
VAMALTRYHTIPNATGPLARFYCRAHSHGGVVSGGLGRRRSDLLARDRRLRLNERLAAVAKVPERPDRGPQNVMHR